MGFVLLRTLLAVYFNPYAHRIDLNPLHIPSKILMIFEHFFVMSYSKSFWPITIVYWLGLAILMYQIIKRQQASRGLLGLALYGILTGSLVFVMGYFASRALYGASLVFHSLLVVFIAKITQPLSLGKKWAIYGLISASFIGQNWFIFSEKTKNYKILEQKEQELISEIQQCISPCRIPLDSIDKGFGRGWLMHADYAEDFAKWVVLRHKLEMPEFYFITPR